MATSSTSTHKQPTSIDPRKDMLTAIDAVAKRGGISRDRAITAWYAATLLGIDEDEAIDAASVDGPEDGGADFIYIDHDQEVTYVSDHSPVSPCFACRRWNELEKFPHDRLNLNNAGRPCG